MPTSSMQKKAPFSPHRGAFRYLLIKNPVGASTFCERFGFSVTELLCADVFSSAAMIDALWYELLQLSKNDEVVWLSAGRLFQLHDLGERSWLVYYSSNFQKALAELKRIDLLSGVSVDESECTIRIKIPEEKKQETLILHYFSSGLVMNLVGLSRIRNLVRSIDIPINHSVDFERNISIWKKFAAREWDVNVTHGGENLAIQFDHEKCLFPLQTSDAALSAFFEHRFIQNKKVISQTKVVNRGSGLIDKIRQSIKSNLNKEKSGAQRIADEMRISVRTLERSLAHEGLTLRSMKREIQRDTAIELLQMGMRAKEVALHVGFDDVTSFSRAFSKWTGTPPAQIRKQNNHGQ